MKLSSYIFNGMKSYGIYTDQGIIDLKNKMGENIHH